MQSVSLPLFRKSLLLAICVCLLIVGYSLVRDPAILFPLRTGLVFLTLFLVILLSYTAVIWRLTRNTMPQDAQIPRHGLNWGLLISAFWLVEILAGNLANGRNVLVRIIYFGASALAFMPPLIAGVWGARKSRHIRTGGLIGLWSGLASGLITFIALMAVTYLFLNTLLQDPQNRLQFQTSGAPDLTTFVIGDSLAARWGI